MQLIEAISKWIDRCVFFLGRDRKVSKGTKDALKIVFTLPDERFRRREGVLPKNIGTVAARGFCREYRAAHPNPGTERRPPRWNLLGIRILGIDERCSEKRTCRA